MENTPQPWRLSVIRKKPEGSHAVFGLFSLYLSLLILLILIKSFAGGHAELALVYVLLQDFFHLLEIVRHHHFFQERGENSRYALVLMHDVVGGV